MLLVCATSDIPVGCLCRSWFSIIRATH